MSRLLAVLTLLAMLVAPLAQGPRSALAQADGVDGNIYTDPTYGFVVEWPKNDYDATALEYEDGAMYGVDLSFEGGFGMVAAFANETAEDCLDAPTEVIRALDGVTKFRETTKYDTDGLTRELESRFVTYTYQPEGQDEPSTHANFFGCEPMEQNGDPVDGVFLYFEFGDNTGDFVDSFAAFIEVMNGVTFGDGTANDSGGGDLGQIRDDKGSTDGEDTNTGNKADATGISATGYIDPTYGFGVTFGKDANPEVAVDSDGNQIGVAFGPADFATYVRSWGGTTARACVQAYVDTYDEVAVDGEVTEADDLDLPDSPDADRSALIRFDFQGKSDPEPVSWLTYVECRQMVQDGEPVEDVFLTVTSVVLEEVWADSLDPLTEILASITFDAKADTSDTGDTTGNDNTGSDVPADGIGKTGYVDPVYAFAVSYGADANPEAVVNPDGDQIGVTFGDGYNLSVRAVNENTARACVNAYVDTWSELDSDGDAEPSEDLAEPESPAAERSAVVLVNYTTDAGEDVDFGGYVECRSMIQDGEEVEDTWLAVTFLSTVDTWDDNLPDLEDAIASVAFDASAESDTSGTDSTDTNTDTDNTGTDTNTDSGDTGGIDGASYTSAVGYALTWDDAEFTGELVDDANPDAGVVLSGSGAILQFQAFADPTLDDCVNAELNVVGDLDGMGPLTAGRARDSLDPAADSLSAFMESTLELNSGTADIFVYVECRPLGTELDGNPLALVIRFVVIQDAYGDLQEPLQTILDGIELTN